MRVSNSSFQVLTGFAALAALVATSACIHGNYRVVKRAQGAGELALEGPQEEARQKAEQYMAQQCASGYDIVEEGEAVVGQTASSDSRKQTTLFGGPATNTQTTTQDRREWRIKYACKGAAAAAPEGAPAAAPKTGQIRELILRF